MRLATLLPIIPIFHHATALPAGSPTATPALRPSPVTADYPTTTTLIATTTESSTAIIQFINPRVVTIVTMVTATTLRPGPVTALPATVVETVISHITFEFRTSLVGVTGAAARTTSVSSAVVTEPSTWVVDSPRVTELAAADATAEALP